MSEKLSRIKENYRKSLFSLSFYHPSCLVIVFIKKNFSLFYPSRRTKKFRGFFPSDVEQYYSYSSVREEKPSPFIISSIIATATPSCNYNVSRVYIPLSFTSLRRDFPLRCFLVKREETFLHRRTMT